MLPDFEYVWNLYPKRPRGSKKGSLVHFNAHVKTEQDMADILLALENYCAELKENQTENRYIKDAKTWFNNWKDYAVETPPERPAQATLGDIPAHYCTLCDPNHEWRCELKYCMMPRHLVCKAWLDKFNERRLAAAARYEEKNDGL